MSAFESKQTQAKADISGCHSLQARWKCAAALYALLFSEGDIIDLAGIEFLTAVATMYLGFCVHPGNLGSRLTCHYNHSLI